MKKEYRISGLDCENCARKLEDKLKKEDYIIDFKVSSITKKMLIESDEQERAIEYIKKVEKGVKITAFEESHNHTEDEDKTMYIRLAICGILIVVSLFISPPIQTIFLIIAYIIVGYKVLYRAFDNLLHGKLFDEFFLMSLATIAALLIGETFEAVLVMFLYLIGEAFQQKALDKSRKSISELLESQLKEVEVIRGNAVMVVELEEIKVGDILKIKPGQKIPVDCKVKTASLSVDTSALTGESIPRKFVQGEEIYAGMIVENSNGEVEAIKDYNHSAIAKMIEMVENANENKAKRELLVTNFAKVYTPIVVLFAFLLVITLPFFGVSFSESINRAIILLVISCPCALVISVPLGYFVSIGSATKKGVLIKGATYVDVLNDIDTLVVDKTGTLTKGNFEVNSYFNYSEYEDKYLFKILAIGEKSSSHPIAKSICNYYKKMYGKEIESVNIQEIKGQGIKYNIDNFEVLVGNKYLLQANGMEVEKKDVYNTVVYMALNNKLVLMVDIRDQIKKDTKEAITKLKQTGIKRVIMLTGDNEKIAKKVANELGIDEYYANLLPEDKISKLKEIKKGNNIVGYIGDGINDAPVISMADIGMAMGNFGSDIAIESADVVINNDSLLSVVEARKVMKKSVRIIKQNIMFAVSIKFIFIVLGIFGIATMWEAIFGDVGVTILAILNCLRILKD